MTTYGPALIRFSDGEISVQDAAAFMNERAVGEQLCPVCQQKRWSFLLGDHEGAYAGIPTFLDDTESPAKRAQLQIGGRSIPIFSVACDNCGFIRNHSLFVLKNWVDARAGRETDD